MAWKDNLRRASFRGAEFFFEDAGLDSACRRVQTHEFAFRDTPYTEDLGRSAESFPIEAYVIGDDYMSRRDALREACEREGPGELVHPYFGSVQVLCSGCSIKESTAEGRMARFSLVFVEAGEKNYPGEKQNAEAAAEASSEELSEAAASDFGKSFSVEGWQEFVGVSALSELREFYSAVGSVINDVASVIGEVDSFIGEVTSLLLQPLRLAERVQAIIASVADRDTSSSALTGETDGSVVRSLTVLGSFGEYKTSDSESQSTQRIIANNNAITALVRRSAAAEAVSAAAVGSYQTRQDAEAVRAGVTDVIDTEADFTLDSDVSQALAAARAALVTALPADGLPELIEMEIRRPVASLVLAYDVYEDALRGDEIVRRNNASHPGFISGTVQLVSGGEAA